MKRQTMQQQLDYWQRLLPVGSVWLTQQLTCRFVSVKAVFYDLVTGYLLVEYTREDAPKEVFHEKVSSFYNYIVSHQVQ